MLPTCRVHCAVFDNDGSPIAGAVVTAKLDRFEVYQGYVVPDVETATTDETGACVLALWPNELGSTASSYAVKIIAPNGRTQRLTVTVPNVADANLHEIAGLPAYEGKPDGQLIIDAAVAAVAPAVAAKITAEAARDSASGYRLNAQLAQEAAQAAEAAAEAARDAAQASAGQSAVSAADAAQSSTAAAGSATSAASSAATANARATTAESAATTATAAAQTATAQAGEASDSAAAALAAQGAAQTAATAAQGAQTAVDASAAAAQSAAAEAQAAAASVAVGSLAPEAGKAPLAGEDGKIAPEWVRDVVTAVTSPGGGNRIPQLVAGAEVLDPRALPLAGVTSLGAEMYSFDSLTGFSAAAGGHALELVDVDVPEIGKKGKSIKFTVDSGVLKSLVMPAVPAIYAGNQTLVLVLENLTPNANVNATWTIGDAAFTNRFIKSETLNRYGLQALSFGNSVAFNDWTVDAGSPSWSAIEQCRWRIQGPAAGPATTILHGIYATPYSPPVVDMIFDDGTAEALCPFQWKLTQQQT